MRKSGYINLPAYPGTQWVIVAAVEIGRPGQVSQACDFPLSAWVQHVLKGEVRTSHTLTWDNSHTDDRLG